ncbi:MAG TPA: hypothetical protein VHE37_05275, partial [Nevskiaceae bacterium]|nr:hypothetical protein [Nevskiaceae bacterium]
MAKGLDLSRHSRAGGNPVGGRDESKSKLDSGLRRNDEGFLARPATKHSTSARQIVPGARARYLAEIADTNRGYRKRAEHQAQLARERQHLRETIRMMEHSAHPVEDLKAEMHKRLDHLT